MPDVGSTPARPAKKADDTLQDSSKSGAQLAIPFVDKPLNATQAGTIGLPGASPVVPTPAEVATATTPPDPTVSRGYAEPGLSNKDVQPPLVIPPAPVAPPQIAEAPKAAPPVVANAAGAGAGPVAGPAPSAVKEAVANIIADHAKTSPPGESWQDYLKGAMGRVGEFLQRWGLNAMGAPQVQTHGEIKQAQQFELAKAEKQAQIQAQVMAAENQYQTQRMQLQTVLNDKSMSAQQKQAAQNQLAALDREAALRISSYGPELKMLMAQRQWLPGAQAETHALEQGK